MGSNRGPDGGFQRRLEAGRNNAGSLAQCPVRNVMDVVSGRWSTLLIMALAERSYRYGELKRLVPDISQRMLTQTLQELQRDGYIDRRVFPTKPPGVEYSITKLGRSMYSALSHLIDWSESNIGDVLKARANFNHADDGQNV